MAIGLAGVHVVKIVGEAKQEGSERSNMKVKEMALNVIVGYSMKKSLAKINNARLQHPFPSIPGCFST